MKSKQTTIIVIVVISLLAVLLIGGIVTAVLLTRFVIKKPNAAMPNTAVEQSEAESIATSTAQPTTEPPTTAAPPTDVTAATESYYLPANNTPGIRYASTFAGTVLAGSNVTNARSFGADQAIDKKGNTCWCVNTSYTGGAGAKISFTLDSYSYVSGIRIINGNTFRPDEGIYSSNGQVKSFTLTFSNGETRSFVAQYNYGSNYYEVFRFDEPIATSSIILTVDSGYPGAKYTTNVCLGEFDVF